MSNYCPLFEIILYKILICFLNFQKLIIFGSRQKLFSTYYTRYSFILLYVIHVEILAFFQLHCVQYHLLLIINLVWSSCYTWQVKSKGIQIITKKCYSNIILVPSNGYYRKIWHELNFGATLNFGNYSIWVCRIDSIGITCLIVRRDRKVIVNRREKVLKACVNFSRRVRHWVQSSFGLRLGCDWNLLIRQWSINSTQRRAALLKASAPPCFLT